METSFHYDTAVIAISELKKQGFTIDFNLEKNWLTDPSGQYRIEDFEIVDIYRYEGNSDPADEMIIYAISSAGGDKGVFIAAYGTALDERSARVIAGLKKSA